MEVFERRGDIATVGCQLSPSAIPHTDLPNSLRTALFGQPFLRAVLVTPAAAPCLNLLIPERRRISGAGLPSPSGSRIYIPCVTR